MYAVLWCIAINHQAIRSNLCNYKVHIKCNKIEEKEFKAMKNKEIFINVSYECVFYFFSKAIRSNLCNYKFHIKCNKIEEKEFKAMKNKEIFINVSYECVFYFFSKIQLTGILKVEIQYFCGDTILLFLEIQYLFTRVILH